MLKAESYFKRRALFMVQRWRPPSYPEEPLYQDPDYYQDPYYDFDDRSWFQRSLPFGLGSCLTLLICLCGFGCFVAFWTTAWFGGDAVLTRLDGSNPTPEVTSGPEPVGVLPPGSNPFGNPPSSGTPESSPPTVPAEPVATEPASPPAVTGPGTSAANAVRIEQPLASSDGLEVTVLDVRRDLNLAEPSVEPGYGFLSVSLKLNSLKAPNEQNGYDPLDFVLADSRGAYYQVDPVADNGRRLTAGQMVGGTVIDGDLIFTVPLEEQGFFLLWETGTTGDIRWFNLQP
jgi:hypothetical protein